MAEGGGLTYGQRVGIGFAIVPGSVVVIVVLFILALFFSEVRRRRHWKRERRTCEEVRRQREQVYPDVLPMHEAPVDIIPIEPMPEEPEPAVIHDNSYQYYCKARDAASESVARDDGLPSYDPLPAYTPGSGGNHTGDVSRTKVRRYGDDAC